MRQNGVFRELAARIERHLFHGKVIVLYGARQVGKTTLARELLAKHSEDSLYLTCDEPDRSEEHTSELQSRRDLHSFPTRRSSDLDRLVRCSPGGEDDSRSGTSGKTFRRFPLPDLR